jgi:immunity protein 52 of polymorphic toxin system
MIRFELLAYWLQRRESAAECVERLRVFFDRLTHCDPSLATWFRLGRSRKQALQHRLDVTNPRTLRAMLRPSKVFESLGYRVATWNGGEPDREVGLSLNCGAFSEYKDYPNNVILRLPEELGNLAHSSRMRDVLTATIDAWNPHWALIVSREATDARGFDGLMRPFVDWMLFANREFLPTIPALPEPATAEAYGEGTIVIVQDSPPDPTNIEHVGHIRRVEAALCEVWTGPCLVPAKESSERA